MSPLCARHSRGDGGDGVSSQGVDESKDEENWRKEHFNQLHKAVMYGVILRTHISAKSAANWIQPFSSLLWKLKLIAVLSTECLKYKLNIRKENNKWHSSDERGRREKEGSLSLLQAFKRQRKQRREKDAA